jgi:hypothetical protein
MLEGVGRERFLEMEWCNSFAAGGRERERGRERWAVMV